MKILFFSSTGFGAELLHVLLESNHQVVGVVTRSDKIRKRGNVKDMTPVKKMALEHTHGVPVFEMDGIDENGIKQLQETRPDILLVVAYGVILPKEALKIGKKAINIHASLLPKYRGATPIESAIMNGDEKTGITFMEMDKGMDTGPTYVAFEVPMEMGITFDELEETLLQRAKETLIQTLEKIESGELTSTPQGEGATYTKKLIKDDFILDFNHSRKTVMNRINALDSHVGARASFQGKNIKFFKAELGNVNVPMGHITTNINGIFIGAKDGSVKINQIQVPGKRKMDAADFMRGNAIEGRFDGY